MAIGDIFMEDSEYGLEEVHCSDCVGLTGLVDLDCQGCDGEGICYELIAPEGEIEAAFANISSQIPDLNTKH